MTAATNELESGLRRESRVVRSSKATLSARVPELDLLRFAAASAVVVYHLTYHQALDGVTAHDTFNLASVSRFGYLGVNLFFMISGFVILWSSQNRSATDFVISRVLRLYPGLWICVLLTSGALILSGATPSIRQVALNFTMIPNQFNTEYIDGVYWTLFAELKFYGLVFAMLVTGAIRHMDAVVGVWLACCLAGAAALTPHWLESLSLNQYGPFFISGCIFYLIRSDKMTAFRAIMVCVSCVLCTVLAIEQQFGFMRRVTTNSSIVVGCAVVGFHLLFVYVALARSGLPNLRLWYSIGALTYPLYLLHNRIGKMVLARAAQTISTGFALLLSLATAYFLAWIVAAFLEPRVRAMLKSTIQALLRRQDRTAPHAIRP